MLPSFTPVGRDSFLYIFSKSFLASFVSLPFQTLEKCHSTIHSFLKGSISLYFLNRFFYHPSLLSHSMLLGGACQMTFPSFSSLLCHSILWEGTDFLCLRNTLVSSLIALSFHTLRGSAWPIFLAVCHSSLSEGVDYQRYFSKLIYGSILSRKTLHSFLSEGMEFSIFFESLLCHPPLLYHSILWRGASLFDFFATCFLPSFGSFWSDWRVSYIFGKVSSIILHCWPIPYCRGGWYPCFLSKYYPIILCWGGFVYFLATCYRTFLHSWIWVLIFRFSKNSSIILHCSVIPCY